MNGLDGLKALLQKKRQETQDLVGDKKYVRKSELEEAKLKRLREEEEQERRAKVIVLLQHVLRLSPYDTASVPCRIPTSSCAWCPRDQQSGVAWHDGRGRQQ